MVDVISEIPTYLKNSNILTKIEKAEDMGSKLEEELGESIEIKVNYHDQSEEKIYLGINKSNGYLLDEVPKKILGITYGFEVEKIPQTTPIYEEVMNKNGETLFTKNKGSKGFKKGTKEYNIANEYLTGKKRSL